MSIPVRSVAIVGATGMLGQAMCREAGRRGYPVATVARRGADHLVDATQSTALRAALDAIQPAFVINAAAQTNLEACEQDPGAAYAINAGLVATLADYCGSNGIKLIHVSTDHFFTGDTDRLHDEQAPVRLVNEYARTKYAGEVFAATCANSLILRTNLVGFRGWTRPTFVEWAIAALRSAEPVTLFDDFFTSSLDADCFAVVTFDLLARCACGTLNVAARNAVSKAAFVTMLAQRLGLGTTHCRIGSVREMSGTRRAESLGLDVGRAEALLGYTLPDAHCVVNALAELARTHEEKTGCNTTA
jgi:dTDP-4-dehydrorhamnose reductase